VWAKHAGGSVHIKRPMRLKSPHLKAPEGSFWPRCAERHSLRAKGPVIMFVYLRAEQAAEKPSGSKGTGFSPYIKEATTMGFSP
jgi:hypothetical protein